MSDTIARALAGLQSAATEVERLRQVAAHAQDEIDRLNLGVDAPDEPLCTYMINRHQATLDAANRIIAEMTMSEDLA